MTPHKATNGRGTFLVDRVFPGIGRVRRASGTTSARTFQALNRMLDDCYNDGALSALGAIRDGSLTLLTAYTAYRRGGVKAIPDAPAMRDVAPLWVAWQDATPNPETRRDRGTAWRRLEEMLADGATVAALPDAVREARTALMEHPPTFNRLRSAVLAFLRDQLGRRHATYLEVSGTPGLKETPARRVAPTPEHALRTRDALPAKAAAIWWSMVTTGMGPHELDGEWHVDGDTVFIGGTKRAARRRIVPRIAEPARRAMGWKQLRLELVALGVQPYDGRRAFAHLLEESGVPRTRRKMYLGHAAGDVTGGYETAELREYLAADRLKVLARLTVAEAKNAADRRREMRSA